MKYLIIKGGSNEDFDTYKKVDELNNSDGIYLVVLGTKACRRRFKYFESSSS